MRAWIGDPQNDASLVSWSLGIYPMEARRLRRVRSTFERCFGV